MHANLTDASALQSENHLRNRKITFGRIQPLNQNENERTLPLVPRTTNSLIHSFLTLAAQSFVQYSTPKHTKKLYAMHLIE